MTSNQPTARSNLSDITLRLKNNGLYWLGSFDVTEADLFFPKRSHQPRAIAIIGNVGSTIWPYFDAARKHRPGLTLDQWTENVVGQVASEFDLEAVYPFKGPPYSPFIQWAKRTGTFFSSPIGLTIHPVYGLWTAFRAALLFDHPLEGSNEAMRHPCDTCADRPCLTTCPVSAFTEEGYAFETCLDHVASSGNACSEGGCLARIACPIGQDHHYDRPHAAFHMQQLLKAHGRA